MLIYIFIYFTDPEHPSKDHHLSHMKAFHPGNRKPSKSVSYSEAKEECLNGGKHLLNLTATDLGICASELEGLLHQGAGYWVGLTRTTRPRWIDGKLENRLYIRKIVLKINYNELGSLII